MRILVVYCGRASASAEIAASIAEELEADTEIIDEQGERKGTFGLVRSFVDLIRDPSPVAVGPSTEAYDVVVVAASRWQVTTSPRLRSVLARRKGAAAFVYVGHRESGARAFLAMERSLGHAPVAGLVLDRKDLAKDASRRKTIDFADEVRRIAKRIVERRSPPEPNVVMASSSS